MTGQSAQQNYFMYLTAKRKKLTQTMKPHCFNILALISAVPVGDQTGTF